MQLNLYQKVTSLIILFFAVIPAQGLTQELDWATSIGDAIYDEGNSIAVDASGSVYSTGHFSGTCDFDPGPGTFNLTANSGLVDCYVSKLNASGNLVWVKQLGGPGAQTGNELVVDASGNVYIAGDFSGTCDFDPGPGAFNLTSVGVYDIFVCKLDESGNFVWAKQMGASGNNEASSIAVDDAGNVYTTGKFFSTVDFDPGPGTFNLMSEGNADIFISKLDASGNFVWAKKIGGNEYDQGNGIAVDASGNILISGIFAVGADFDPGPGSFIFNALGVLDIFVLKLDASGNFMWAKQIGSTTGYGQCYSICTDDVGNVYSCGYFGGTVDFDPGPGTANLVSVESGDAFACKLDAAGNFMWAKNIVAGVTDSANDIAVDVSGNVYTTGYFGGTADFDPGPGTFNLTSAGGPDDIYISKLDVSGNFLWAQRMGGIEYDQGFSIALNNAGNVHVIGNFMSTVDFDPGSGAASYTAVGQYDVFIVKLNDCAPAVATENITECAPYTWKNGVTYTASQTGVVYTVDDVAAGGCDSVYTLNLTILNTTNSANVVTACNSYTWINGVTYTVSNSTATHTLTNVAGCDSVVTLNLTITNSNAGTDVISACDAYTWIDGVTYTNSNSTATYTLTNSDGCDSIVTLNLTITNSPDLTVSDNGFGILTASSASSYQWIDCTTNLEISGETNSTFSPAANGTYAVIGYTATLCADTSNCVMIDYLGSKELDLVVLTIVPNPTSDAVMVSFNAPSAQLIIRDVQGKQIKVIMIEPGENISLEDLGTGIYFFELITPQNRTVKRVMKM